jgi:hypothetical protein
MSEESLLRARLALELREAQQALVALEDERARLSRKNELLVEVLLALRDGAALPELAQQAVDRALSYDGQPWSLPQLDDDDDDADPNVEP